MNLLSFENEKFATLFSIVQGEKENEKMHSFHKRDKSNYKINSTKQKAEKHKNLVRLGMRRQAAQNLDKRNDKSQGFAGTLEAAEQRNGGGLDGGVELKARV